MISVKFSTLFWCQNWFKANLSAGFAGEFVFAFNQIEQILVTFLSVFWFFYGFWCRVCFAPFSIRSNKSRSPSWVFSLLSSATGTETCRESFHSFPKNQSSKMSDISGFTNKLAKIFFIAAIWLNKLGSSRPFGIQWDTGLCLQQSACQKFLTNPRMHPHRGISMFDC